MYSGTISSCGPHYSHCSNERTDDALFFSRAHCPIQVPGVGGKACVVRTGPGRVLWMSSFAAHAHTFDADDWQLVNSTMPRSKQIPDGPQSCRALALRGPVCAGPPLRGASRRGGLVHIRGARQRPFDLCQDFHVLSRAFQYQICVCLGLN